MEEWAPTGKTKIITILSMHDDTNLGTIRWNGRWRQYVFEPTMEEETIWSWECLEDLKGFIIQLNKEQENISPPNPKGMGIRNGRII